jgi:diacylglycerol kinase (ATP)
MRIAAIFGLGSGLSSGLSSGLGSPAKYLRPFTRNISAVNMDAVVEIGLPHHKSEADAILIFGGDGTVHRYLAELVALQLPVLVVPRGSGNDFARALNIRSVDEALEAWRQFVAGRDNVRSVDLGRIIPLEVSDETEPPPSLAETSQDSQLRNGTYFCCIGGVGLDAEITRRANRLPRWIRRHGGYALSLPPALIGFRPLGVRIESSFPCGGTAMLVAFANAQAYGDGIRIAPKAQLDDGKLDICMVGEMGKLRLLRLFPSLYSGGHLGIPEVKYFQTDFLRIYTETPVEVYADGEYVCRTPVEISVQPAALRVIVPE